MRIKSVNRYQQLFFDLDKVDKHWDKQVWFWKRKQIYRIRIPVDDITNNALSYEQDVQSLYDQARNALHGVGILGFNHITFAFRSKADAMLFKLAHGGE